MWGAAGCRNPRSRSEGFWVVLGNQATPHWGLGFLFRRMELNKVMNEGCSRPDNEHFPLPWAADANKEDPVSEESEPLLLSRRSDFFLPRRKEGQQRKRGQDFI